MSRTVEDLVGALAAVSPTLAELRREHLAEYGELLPHLFVADVRRWLAASAAGGDPPVDAALRVLEDFAQVGDEGVVDVLGASFLEGLGLDPAEPGERLLRERLGPSLAARLRRMESWRP